MNDDIDGMRFTMVTYCSRSWNQWRHDYSIEIRRSEP